jgi:uncharacterized protein YndB with AHSA1/START domain
MAVFEGEVRTQIDAPPQKVWELVSDVTRMGEWSPENTGAEWLGEATGPVVGARFKGSNRRGWMKWSTECEVLAAEPGKVFSFATVKKSGDQQTIWTYTFEPVGEGTAVTERYEVLTYPVYLKVIGPPKRRGPVIDEGITKTLQALKEKAEAG